MTAELPAFKLQKIISLIKDLCQTPCRKNLEKIIGIVLWATSLVHHIRFVLTTLYTDLYAIPAKNYSVQPTQWSVLLNILNDDAIISQQNSLQLPVGGRIVEFKHKTISSKNQLPIDISIERHAWVRIRDPSTDKRKPFEGSKLTLSWINTSLLPLLSSIPLNRSCQLTIQAAADAFATEDTMGIGGWVTINSATFWFSQLWRTEDLQKFLPISKALQRYITSWEALLPNSALSSLFSKNPKPDRESSTSNQDPTDTGAEANTNHGFSTTEVLADIIKLVSITQIKCNTLLNVHHIPGEKNILADDLSRGKLSSFSEDFRICFDLAVIFDSAPFPRWDLDIHPLAK